MTDTVVQHASEPVVRVRTLLILRWLAILGQLAAILFVALLLDFTMPTLACLALVAASAWSNVFLRIKFADDRRIPGLWAAGVLAFDIVQLSAQLALTGGLTNPFAVLIIAPVMVSAITLSANQTLSLGALALLALTALAIHHMPLPWYEGERFQPPFLYIGGLWLALTLSLGFMGTYAFRVAEERRQLGDALNAAEMVLSREQHIHALDGLAAAAAHELGTPLATILLVAREMEREVDPAHPIAEDVRLLRSQTERCREILAKLKTLGEDTSSPLQRLNVASLLEEVVAPYRDGDIAVDVQQRGLRELMPVLWRNPAVHYGLGNLLENAVDFATDEVRVEAKWDANRLVIAISDDGPGFPDAVLDRLGDPFVSRRQDERRGGGLGLGIFIAKTLLERTGATVAFRRGSGATVIVTWPRDSAAMADGGAPRSLADA